MATTIASPAIPRSPLLRFAQKPTKPLLSLPFTQKCFSSSSSSSSRSRGMARSFSAASSPPGKYIREDYLVVNGATPISQLFSFFFGIYMYIDLPRIRRFSSKCLFGFGFGFGFGCVPLLGGRKQRKVSAKEVQEMIKGERSVPLVVDFYATWCGPCVLMAQELEMLAVEYENNALFVKVDTDDEYEFARDMQVRGLPTLYFISPDPNKDAIRTEGLVPPEMIKNIIDNEM